MGLALENIFQSKKHHQSILSVNLNTDAIEKISTFSLERTLNAYMRYSF